MRQITAKTRFLNFFRRIFKLNFLELRLSEFLRGNPVGSTFFKKFVPNNYQYPSPSLRTFSHRGLRWTLDISDYIGHTAYFGLDRSTDKLFELCSVDSVLFDVGVNIGWTALYSAQLCSRGQVYGFEPDSANWTACQNNISLNPQLSNLSVLPIALGAEDALVNIEVAEPSNRGGNRVKECAHVADGNIQMTTLDNFVSKSGICRLDVIKIDTEGYEMNVLRGAQNTLGLHHPALFIELSDVNLRHSGSTPRELILLLQQLGYTKLRDAHNGSSYSPDYLFDGIYTDIIATI